MCFRRCFFFLVVAQLTGNTSWFQNQFFFFSELGSHFLGYHHTGKPPSLRVVFLSPRVDLKPMGSQGWFRLGPYCAFVPPFVYAMLGTSPHASISSGRDRGRPLAGRGRRSSPAGSPSGTGQEETCRTHTQMRTPQRPKSLQGILIGGSTTWFSWAESKTV